MQKKKVLQTGITDIQKIEEILKKEGYHSIFQWSDSPNTYYDWHTHPYQEVRWIISGSITIGTEDGEFNLKPGDVIFVSPGEKHWAKTDEGVTYICASK